MKAPRGKKKDWNVIIYKKKNGCIIGTNKQQQRTYCSLVMN